MKQAEMFGADVDYGPPNFVSLAKARRLLVDVIALADVMDETFVDRCEAVADRARRMGAHSVVRAVTWLYHCEVLGRHGYDAMHFRVEDVARRWVARQEQAATLERQ